MAKSKMTKTMTKEWRDFLKYARSQHWKKYFPDDGNETCAYNTEHDNSSIVQAAIRRQRGKTESYITEKQKEVFSKILGKDKFSVNVVYITCSYKYGGIWIYDETDLINQGGKKIASKQRGVNDYYLIDISKCHKIVDLWDVMNQGYRTKYAVARNQYEHMITDGIYDKVKTWKDLPDYCLWKYQNPDGSIIPGREEAFEEYKTKTMNRSGFIKSEL